MFQDVYAWAGKIRTVDIAKNNDMFCRAVHVAVQLQQRLAAIKAEKGLRGLDSPKFVERLAEHISELNAIHPFREGNGRAMRALLVVIGRQAGHAVEIHRIDAVTWMAASRESFRSGDTGLMRAVISSLIAIAS